MARKTPEGRFKEEFSKDLAFAFPDVVMLKNDEQLLQGVPDMLVLYKDKWAMLEFKAHAKAAVQPNQRYYISFFDSMGFGAFVYPENRDDVIEALERHFS